MNLLFKNTFRNIKKYQKKNICTCIQCSCISFHDKKENFLVSRVNQLMLQYNYLPIIIFVFLHKPYKNHQKACEQT
jgi:hypothetical protein